MGSVPLAVIAGIAGILAGAVGMRMAMPGQSLQPADNDSGQFVALLDGMNGIRQSLQDIRDDIAVNRRTVGEQPAEDPRQHMKSAPPQEPASTSDCRDVQEVVARDMAVEEAMLQNLVTRLNDPVYIGSTTLAEVMRSDEMHALSSESRERVIVDLLGRINRGEIDANAFLGGAAAN